MGPETAKSFRGMRLVAAADGVHPAGRATQEADYGRRGGGYIYGAFLPACGRAFTQPYPRRRTEHWIDFLVAVEAWLPAEAGRVYAILDNLNVHHTHDVLLFSALHPRREFVFQPVYAGYLNLIEPWWKVLRSLALKGRRFESWAEICAAVAAVAAYWNRHRHPFVWGQRRRHRSARPSGIALAANVR
jgi:hypothetical protein